MALARVGTIWGTNVTGGGITSSYFDVTPLDATSAQTCIDLIRDFWTSLAAIIRVGTTWTVSGSVQQIDPVTGDITAEFGVLSRAGAGSATGDQLPLATQGLVRWTTGSFINGRRVQGHWNIPAPTESNNGTGGSPDSTYTTTLTTAANTLNASANPTLVVFSRRNGQFRSVASVVAVGKWGVLRSRRD